MAMPEMGVSIIVCCYNSANRLPQTLAHIANQKVDINIKWELIIVDNASKDHTAKLAKEEWEKHRCQIAMKVVSQPVPGLTHAKEKGFDTAQYEYLLFVDDDNWIGEYYVQLAYDIMNSNQTIGMLGGKSQAAFEIAPPNWFEKFKAVYAVGEQWHTNGPLPINQGYIYGASSIIRRSAWNKLRSNGFTSLAIGRSGQTLTGGEDVELGNALRLAGYTLWYDDRLIFSHFLPKERLSWQYLVRVGKEGISMSDVVYYFVLRYPDISDNKFILLYLKRLVWLSGQVVRYPITYLQKKQDEKLVYKFDLLRTISNLLFSVKKLPFILQDFRKVMAFKHRIHTHND